MLLCLMYYIVELCYTVSPTLLSENHVLEPVPNIRLLPLRPKRLVYRPDLVDADDTRANVMQSKARLE